MTPERDAFIIAQTVQGVPTRAVGAALGLSHTSIERHQSRLRNHIIAEANAILNRGLVSARRTVCRFAAIGAGKLPTNKDGAVDKDLCRLSLDASKVVLQAAGILSQGGTVINNLIQINQAQQAPEAVARVLAQISRNDTASGNLLAEQIPPIDV